MLLALDRSLRERQRRRAWHASGVRQFICCRQESCAIVDDTARIQAAIDDVLVRVWPL